jgi:hypothetical protein
VEGYYYFIEIIDDSLSTISYLSFFCVKIASYLVLEEYHKAKGSTKEGIDITAKDSQSN